MRDSVGKYFSLLPMAEKGAKENQSDQIVKYCIILAKASCYGSKTCCEGCFMLILFHVLSLIWGQFYRSLDNDLTCSGNRCLEQQLGTTEEPIQPIGINSLCYWIDFSFCSSVYFGLGHYCFWFLVAEGGERRSIWMLLDLVNLARVCACFAELTGSRWKRCRWGQSCLIELYLCVRGQGDTGINHPPASLPTFTSNTQTHTFFSIN